MSYYILDNQNQQMGPFTIDQLRLKGMTRNTLVWRQGLANWTEAYLVEDLNELFLIPPPPLAQQTNYTQQNPYNSNYNVGSNINNNIYDENFPISSLSLQQIHNYKSHFFREEFNTAVGIILHFLTFGIFTFIQVGLMHSKLPKIKQDDFGSGKAIGFMFIPFFNLYWIFMFYVRLTRRINFQYKLRNISLPLSSGFAIATCILMLIPYINIISYFILLPVLYGQIQSSVNNLIKIP